MIQLWGGGEIPVAMDGTYVQLNDMTEDTPHRCVNDGGFGCERILSATLYIYEVFDGGYEEFKARVDVAKPNPKLVRRGIWGREEAERANEGEK